MALFKRSPLKSARIVRRRRKLFRARFFLYVSFLIVIIGAVSVVSDQAGLKISTVEVLGNAELDSNDIVSSVQKSLDGSYWFLFTRANRYIYPENKIKNDLYKNFPAIKSVEVRNRGNTLSVSIVERKPAFLWCKGLPSNRDNLGCYLMDKDGFIFSIAPRFSGDAFFAHYGMIFAENPIGLRYLTEDQFETLKKFNDTLSKIDVKIFASLAKEDGSREVYMNNGTKIFFKDNQNPDLILSSLDVIKNNTQLLNPQVASKLEYIDLRFGNKIYYKFIGDNPVQTNL